MIRSITSVARVGRISALRVSPFRVLSVRAFSEIKYLKSHEYIRKEADGTATVGITDFAQSELGDVVYVELPEVGDTFAAGEVFGSVESVKAASSVYSPVDGEVIAVNTALSDDSSLVNSSPMENGWIMKLKLSDASQLDGLIGEEAYTAHCESEKH